MTTHSGIKTEIQKLAPDTELVELYSIDLTPLGEDTIYYFTPGNLGGELVEFNSITYTPIPVTSDGFEHDGQGKLPRPKLIVSNISSALVASIVGFNDLVGARVIRRRTFRKYLDGQASADPTAQFPRDIFYIERKTRQTKLEMEFELISAVDSENTQIPRKQVLESCTHRYRFYDTTTSSWNRDGVTCPYDAEVYFSMSGASVATPQEDDCGRRLTDCKKRFGLVAPLPYEGFPNVAKFEVNYRK